MSASARVIMDDEVVTFADLAAGDWFRFTGHVREEMRRSPCIKRDDNTYAFAVAPLLQWKLSSWARECGVELIPVRGHGEMVDYQKEAAR